MSALAETLIRQPRHEGTRALLQRGAQARELSAWRVRLPPGATAEHRVAGEEAVAVLLEGRGTFDAGAGSWPVSRSGVFTERATAAFVPPGSALRMAADEDMEVVIVSTPAPGRTAAAIARPADIRVNHRGRATYTREVHDIFVTDPHVQRLMVGETFNPPGHWSSFPPHKHDGRDGEPTLEELYYFRVDPPQGFGPQMLYTADGEVVTHAVKDGDAVLLPYGYHPVSSPPGYRLYYLWAMAGAERRLALHEDPDHRWIHDAAL
jgi:5-deoxy-glucuronate isomerase